MRIQSEYISVNNCGMMRTSYDFHVHLQHSEGRCFSQPAQLWFELHPEVSPALRGLLSAIPVLLLVLPGAPRCTQRSLRHSEVFPTLSYSLTRHTCTSDKRSQLLWRPAGMPNSGLILSWHSHFSVYTPHPIRHFWRRPESKIHFADVWIAN